MGRSRWTNVVATSCPSDRWERNDLDGHDELHGAITSAALEIGGPAVLGIDSFRPVNLRPRLSVGFALIRKHDGF